jgi:transcriptional regulator of NAD metabolism
MSYHARMPSHAASAAHPDTEPHDVDPHDPEPHDVDQRDVDPHAAPRHVGRMTATDRRSRIAQALGDGACVSGDALAHELGVSRQVIVQDIAVLRAGGLDVVATVRGYLLAPGASPTAARRVIGVRHRPDQAVEELTALVDTGARVIDVVVEHPVYGELRAELDLRSRRDVQLWAERCATTGARMLSELTDGAHVHTLEADHEQILDAAEDALRRLRFLCEDPDA